MCQKIMRAATKSAIPVVMVSIIASFQLTVSGSRAWGYTPSDPVVTAMVDSGLRFLESELQEGTTGNAGEVVMCAYAHFKADHDPTNPVVQKGISAALQIIDTLDASSTPKFNYEVAVSVFLLCEIDHNKYRSQLTACYRYFAEIQLPVGGFGYKGESVGDVSQTQYIVLALWTMERHGIEVDYNRIKSIIRWLLMVQDPSGGWPYLGTVPPNGRGLVPQNEVRVSMALAAGSSLLIGGDSLGLWGASASADKGGYEGLPKAVKLYVADSNDDRRQKTEKMDSGTLFRAIAAMQAWRSKTKEQEAQVRMWYYYTVYSIERFESFMEIAGESTINPSPDWYNRIVDELKRRQTDKGGWERTQYTSASVSTAFAILFLIRSTKMALGDPASATSRGGYGIPANAANAKLDGGMAVVESPAKSVAEMLSLLEGDGANDLDGKSLMESAVLPTDPVQRAAQLDRLERLVRGSKSWQSRRVAAKILGTSDEFRVVPALIYALSDGDTIVRTYARDGLRFISRKFEGYDMPDDPTNADVRKAQKQWREWYVRMHPGYVFLDE
ncbi:MAG: hypothetical protein KDB00_28660 [Planctomycetales bacterium]|nr:hypothetical protein [Planctomycetales bacterium]